jgi:outer membrane protein
MEGLRGMAGVRVVIGTATAVVLWAKMGLTPVLADTIGAALVRAYQNNPQLNAQRAQVRVQVRDSWFGVRTPDGC